MTIGKAPENDVPLADDPTCRPLLDRDMFTEPASTQEIAEALVITQTAVKQHLAKLYDKFGVGAESSRPSPARQRSAPAWCHLAHAAARLGERVAHDRDSPVTAATG